MQAGAAKAYLAKVGGSRWRVVLQLNRAALYQGRAKLSSMQALLVGSLFE